MFNMRILQLQPAGGTLTTRRDKIKLIMTQLFAVSVNLHLMMMIFSGRSKTIIVRSHYLFPKHAPLEILFISSHFPLAGNTEQQTMTFYFLRIQQDLKSYFTETFTLSYGTCMTKNISIFMAISFWTLPTQQTSSNQGKRQINIKYFLGPRCSLNCQFLP